MRGPRVTALQRKLLRDAWAMKGQAIAIALVIASGVSMFVMYLSNFDSLIRTRASYYDRQRFADVFASLKRAPQRLESRIAEIPGVARAQTRVVADVTLDVAGMTEPATGRIISVPARGRPALNDVFLRAGRWVEVGRDEEVLVSEAFATAHGLQPGASVAAVLNGRWRELRIVGIALSPEYVYSIRPGELIPDDRRFGVFWMERRALASAFDMEGGFNDVALRLTPGASSREVIAHLDRLLRPWGGLGAIPRALQFSHWTLESELTQLENFGVLFPMIFLAVAAFLLNVVLTRTLSIQRPQIASLKALGYSNRELAWHYVQWALLIALLGIGLGVGGGAWLGSGMIAMYNDYFRFPVLQYELSWGVTVAAVVFSLAAAALGGVTAVRRAVAVPPAEAMRPEAPARYRRGLVEGLLGRWLTIAGRIVTRNLERQPLRALASVVGIAFAVAIMVVGLFFIDSMDELMEMQFQVVQRQDVTLSFVEPVSAAARHEVMRLPGVENAEPMRAVPARIRYDHRQRNVAVTGLEAAPRLNRVVDRSGRILTLPPEGLVLSATLGRILHVEPGDRVVLEVLEGERPTRVVPVASLVEEYMGLAAYMEIGALRDLMREGGTLSGAYLEVEEQALPALYREVKRLPMVAGVAITKAALRSFEETLAETVGLMTLFNVLFAGVIAFGVVYNAARISLSERSRELASLRVMGFTRTEISMVLLGELTVLTLLALPLGLALGGGMAWAIVVSFDSEVYRLPFTLTSRMMARAALTVVVAAALSSLVVRRRLDRLDLIGVLKTRE